MSSPQTKEFLRQTRERLRTEGRRRKDAPITVVMSPPMPFGRTPNSERLKRFREGEETYIKFVCNEGQEIFVPQTVACTSG